jgi:hypothetical protein
MISDMHCGCKYCRFPDTHITKYHQCGTCKKFGHGMVECPKNNNGNIEMVTNLRHISSSKEEEISTKNICNKENCKYKNTHTEEAHQDTFSPFSLTDEERKWTLMQLHCSFKKELNTENLSEREFFFLFCLVYSLVKNIFNANGKIYTGTYFGQGHHLYAWRDFICDDIKILSLDLEFPSRNPSEYFKDYSRIKCLII